MKKIFNFLLSSIALIAFIPTMNAQPYTEGTGEAEGLAYSKTIAGPDNGIYTITLESFVLGEVKITQGVPADIVLVLDVSGSMNDDYSTDEYTAQPSASYTYNDFEDGVYYYRDNNGTYYPVTKKSRTSGNTTYYGLYYSVTGSGWFSSTTYYYLKGTTAQNAGNNNNNRPNNTYGVNSPTATIWTGVLYKKTSSQQSRIDALKQAVGGFIDVIAANAESSGQDNQISIVKFATAAYYGSASSLTEGNHRGADNNNNYNYTEVVRTWTDVSSAANVTSLKNSVNAIQAGGATAVDYGLTKANYLLADLPSDRQSAKTVVVFTDGVPTHSNASSVSEVEGVADDAIDDAKTIKSLYAYTDPDNVSHNAKVYTVGVFKDDSESLCTPTSGNPSSYTLSDYMNYLSSNYPSAESLSSPGTGSDEGFYQNAADGDLESIFRSIATASGGAGASLDAGTVEAIDVVSQSFQLPNGASTNIGVYFAACTGKDDDGYLTFAPKASWISNPAEGEDGHVSITITGNTVTASGFDYSDEWCGPDATTGGFHGHKLILQIPIEMADEAVGGQGVDTNGPGSGIFIGGKNILPFESPDVSLPTNIHIQKVGLSDGESAVFKIYRTAANADGTPANSNWTYYKTVIIIEGMNEDSTVKLRGLDPNYAYKIEEAGWSWAYDTTNPEGEDGNPLTEVTSDKLITNPFTFTNTLNTKGQTIIRAESAVVNDFKTSTATNIDSKNTAPKAASKSK